MAKRSPCALFFTFPNARTTILPAMQKIALEFSTQLNFLDKSSATRATFCIPVRMKVRVLGKRGIMNVHRGEHF